jgi:signal transduction histidine kinase
VNCDDVREHLAEHLLGSLSPEVDRDVRQRAEVLAATAGRAPMRVTPPPQLDVFSSPDVYLQLVFPDGSVAASSGNLGDRRLPFFQDDAQTGIVREARMGGVPLIEATRVVKDRTGETDGYAIAARSPRTIYEAVTRLRNVLVPQAAIGLALAGIAGWVLTWLSLRPLQRLAVTAEQIASTTDHTRRVKIGWPRDEIRKLAVTINEMLDSLEQAYRTVTATTTAQRQFLADVSHQLRTPLTIMRSAIEVLERVGRDDPEFAARALRDSREEAERMSRMINQLLLMARTDAPKPAATRPLLIVDLIADLARHSDRLGPDGTIRWKDIDRLEGAVVRGDADYLRELFLVLIDNAVKYTPAGGSVEVSATTEAQHAVVRVTDTGAGIPAEDLPHIFDRFYRAQTGTSQGGAGLGLAIAKQIAGWHGGTIDVESELGQGTQVTIRLPLMS